MRKQRGYVAPKDARLRQSAYRSAYANLNDAARKDIAAVCVRLRSIVPPRQKGMSADTALEIVAAIGALLARET